MKKLVGFKWVMVSVMFFLLPSIGLATEYKCAVVDDHDGRHILLVDTKDMRDAKRAAAASTVNNHFGRPSAVVRVMECKLETQEFSSVRNRVIDSQTPR